MSDNYPLLDRIAVHPLINKMIDDLLFNQLIHEKLAGPKKPIDNADIRKAIWLCSLLATSDVETYRNKGQILASLIYLQYKDNDFVERAIYVLFSRLGNLTGARLLSNAKTFEEISESADNFYELGLDESLKLEVALERNDKSIVSNNGVILATKFQKNLWDTLMTPNNILISAPTSSGKSFIIKKFLATQIDQNDRYTVVYIVPSKALLNQVSEELRKEVNLDEVDIKTVYLHDSEKSKNSEIFILTPERCLRLLKERWEREFNLDFVFVDEIQNVEDVQGRGSLFEFVFREISILFPKAKIVAAGPNISNSISLFNNVFGIEGVAIDTQVSPVFQIKTTIRPIEDNQLKVIINYSGTTSQEHLLSTNVNFKKEFRNIGEGLRELIQLCGADEQNIIYAPTGKNAIEWATKFADVQPFKIKLDPWLKEIIDFLADEIHPLYDLISCLKKETAYHHGNLPDIVRKEIEDCFLENRIKHLFCTTTLIQGVNLPANNLFIPAARKRTLPLTPFDFGNLIGRAGRIRESLYGTIYCIERYEDDDWSEELYSKSYRKEVQTANEQALEKFDDLVADISKSFLDIDKKHDAYAVVYFRQQYAKDPIELQNYLLKRNFSEEEINQLITPLAAIMEELEIPKGFLKLNPTIDPILQNELYRQISNDPIENWLIPSKADNPNFYEKISLEKQADSAFQDLSFYLQLDAIVSRIDAIFHIRDEAFFKHNVSISTKQICFYSIEWFNNKSLRQMIDKDLKFYSAHIDEKKRIDKNDPKAVNERIKKLIKIYSIVITHILIKYLKLVNDIVELKMTEEQKAKYKFALALPTMLELGTDKAAVMLLISSGVSRSIALKVFNEFEKVYGHAEMDIIQWLRSKSELKLKPIYNRYLKRMRLLKDE
jgi:hypothetical protein